MTEPVSIIIPAYNEDVTVEKVVRDVQESIAVEKYHSEIIVVDDGSSDDTSQIALRCGARVIRSSKNRGYGAALKSGILNSSHEIIVIIDSDGTYPAHSIPLLIKELKHADMVVGARTGQDVNIPLIRRPAKWVLRKLAQYITGEKIPDLNSGLRVFHRADALRYLALLSDKFSFTTSITVAFMSHNYKVEFIPVDYYKRKGKSKIKAVNFIDFLVLVFRLSMLFNPAKVFVPIALFCFTIGFAKFGVDLFFALRDAGGITISFLANKVISQSALILWLAGLQILLFGMVVDSIALQFAQSSFSTTKKYCYPEHFVKPDSEDL
ncbi:MAG: glycosyltransferase family 2 protein [Candidatus Auribacterota bacterium]|jgi:glycosyltransferase involved in cell wall biosynthesis|nr:glycosyltransferase family 2 protein [Candidatus Auribacterota bacterium]